MPELGQNGGEFTINQAEGEPPLDFEADELDVTLVEVLSAATFLADSPDVLELERIVRDELNLARRPPT